MELCLYAHPWDLRALAAEGGLERLADLGYGEVALAVSYHAGRWLTPWHPDGMVRFLEDGTVHYRPRGDYGRLVPLPSREVRPDGLSPLERFAEDAAAAGVRARAWAVLTHNTRLGELHRDCCVVNAFGDAYTYALCPANEHVQRYVRTMVDDLAAHRGVETIELEALGWMGHRHNSHHDKSSFAADPWTDWLLSTCFCAACTAGVAALPRSTDGIQVDAAGVERLRRAFAAAARRSFADADCMDGPAPKLGREALLERARGTFGPEVVALLAHRAFVLGSLTTSLSPARLSGRRLCLQTSHDALRGGPALPLPMLGTSVDEVALTAYGENAAGAVEALPGLTAARPAAPAAGALRLRLCLHPRAPQYRSDADLAAVRDACIARRVDSIAVYHLGLLPWKTIERTARVLAR